MDSIWAGFAIGVFSSLIGGFILHFVLNREHDSHVSIKVFEPSDSYESSNFYILLEKALANAREEVIQYAEGFSTDLPERLEKAKAYVGGMRAVLDRESAMKWIRIQTKNPVDEQWLNLLQDLQKDFPQKFKLFLFDNRLGDHLLSVVLIDPRTRFSKIFLLISKPRHIGSESRVNIAHSGVMIKGSRVLSEAFYDRLDDLCDLSARAVAPIESEDHESTR